MLNGFKKFILRGNVVDLSVGIVIGSAFTSVVTALVQDIINPTIGFAGRVPDLSGIAFTVNENKFLVGHFLNTLISFLIAASTMYFFVVLPINTLVDRFKRRNAPKIDPTTKKCPECLSDIPKEATRCAHCTTKFG